MRTSEQTDKIAPAWVAALNALTDVQRSETADAGSYRYRYATLAVAAQQARQVLVKHALGVHQSSHGETVGLIQVSTRVWHESGQWIEAEPLLMPAKGGPQDVGSAISYARRYALMAFLGLATDDDDGAGAQEAARKADEPHPNAQRVADVLAEIKRLPDAGKDALKAWADGRPLSGGSMIRDERWLGDVENWLSEWEHSQRETTA